ncbi:hypothetical protein L0222_01985 [bacterium]|nr:hypothetical protein [bacterium]
MESNLHKEEQGLYEFFHPLIAHWKLIVGGLLVGIVVATAASFLLPKQYETTLLLNIGSAAEKSLEDPHIVTKIINSASYQYMIASKVGVQAPPARLQEMIKAETDSARSVPWVTIRIKADDPQRAVKLANAIADGIIQRHTEFFDEKIQYFKDYKVELEKNLDQFTEEMTTLEENLNSFRHTSHDLQTEMMLQTRLGDRQNLILMFKREMRDMSTWTSEVHSRRTSLASRPVLPKVPTKPNLKLNLVMATVVSLFLMITFVFLLEQYRKGSLDA